MINGRRRSFKRPMMAYRLVDLWKAQPPKAKRAIAEMARNTGCAQFFEAFGVDLEKKEHNSDDDAHDIR
jgi:hypothetical protein